MRSSDRDKYAFLIRSVIAYHRDVILLSDSRLVTDTCVLYNKTLPLCVRILSSRGEERPSHVIEMKSGGRGLRACFPCFEAVNVSTHAPTPRCCSLSSGISPPRVGARAFRDIAPAR